MKTSVTQRGFGIINFTDRYGEGCSIQKSSLASEDAIWFGIDDPAPKIMASQAPLHGVDTDATVGWVEYPIPKEVLVSTRMHLTREQVAELLPVLQHFVATGDVVIGELP